MAFSGAVRVLARLEWQGLAIACLTTLLWLVIFHWLLFARDDRSSWQPRTVLVAGLTALLAGAAIFVPSIAFIQRPLEGAVEPLIGSLLSTSALLAALPRAAISGLVQETSKATAAWLSSLASTATPQSSAVILGLAAGAGYGAVESWIMLSSLLNVSGTIAPQFFWFGMGESIVMVGFHAAAAGVVLCWWTRGAGAGLLALCSMVLYHGALQYGDVLRQAGQLNLAGLLAYTALFTLTLIAYLAYLTARTRPASGSAHEVE